MSGSYFGRSSFKYIYLFFLLQIFIYFWGKLGKYYTNFLTKFFSSSSDLLCVTHLNMFKPVSNTQEHLMLGPWKRLTNKLVFLCNFYVLSIMVTWSICSISWNNLERTHLENSTNLNFIIILTNTKFDKYLTYIGLHWSNFNGISWFTATTKNRRRWPIKKKKLNLKKMLIERKKKIYF